MLKAEDLYLELKTLEERIRHNTDPDGHCNFDAEKVYIMLKTALGFVPESGEQQANS